MDKLELLANLLQEAKRAHKEYEREMGFKDANWAQWYAEYILSKTDMFSGSE